jgi:hypothetical protein
MIRLSQSVKNHCVNVIERITPTRQEERAKPVKRNKRSEECRE